MSEEISARKKEESCNDGLTEVCTDICETPLTSVMKKQKIQGREEQTDGKSKQCQKSFPGWIKEEEKVESLEETPQLSVKSKAEKEDVLEEIWHPHEYFISVKKPLSRMKRRE